MDSFFPQDMAEAKRTELASLIQLVDCSPCAMFIIEVATGKLIFANEKGRKRLGYSQEELRAQRVYEIEEIFPSREAWNDHVELLRNETEVVQESLPRDANGDIFPAEVHARYVESEADDYVVVISQDISERKDLDSALTDYRKKLERWSYQDPLTKIPNRRSFDRRLNIEVKRARRSEAPLSVFMIDLDYFKKYNDRYGHLAGDDCLRKVSETLRGMLTRSEDFMARYGGEEFVVLLPFTDGKAARRMAEKLREAIEDLRIQSEDSLNGLLTISVGVTTLKAGETLSAAELVTRSDQALYEAKQGGRNQVSVYK